MSNQGFEKQLLVLCISQAEFLSMLVRVIVNSWPYAYWFALHHLFFMGVGGAGRALIRSLYFLDVIRHNS